MNANDRVTEQMSAAVAAALAVDLPPVEYRAWTPVMNAAGMGPAAAPITRRRPGESDVEVVSFPQWWGSTGLGHGGVGGAAVTEAQTTVVAMKGRGPAAVYFGHQLAYVVEHRNARFEHDVRHRSMVARSMAGVYCEAGDGSLARYRPIEVLRQAHAERRALTQTEVADLGMHMGLLRDLHLVAPGADGALRLTVLGAGLLSQLSDLVAPAQPVVVDRST